EVVNKAFELGLGKEIDTWLGAKYDTGKCKPVKIKATIVKLVKRWKDEANLALLNISGVQVIVVDEHVGCYDPDMMRAVGIIPEKQNVIIVKLGYLEPEIRKIANHSIMALTKGSSDELFERLTYKKLPRPIYPLDKDFPIEIKLM
ncbi:MAG: MlrC C-terminal domain-containing protein, partial [Sphaerochaetaceae bacterium]